MRVKQRLEKRMGLPLRCRSVDLDPDPEWGLLLPSYLLPEPLRCLVVALRNRFTRFTCVTCKISDVFDAELVDLFKKCRESSIEWQTLFDRDDISTSPTGTIK